MEEPEPQPWHLYEIDFVNTSGVRQTRRVDAISRQEAIEFLKENNSVKRIIRTIDRGIGK